MILTIGVTYVPQLQADTENPFEMFKKLDVNRDNRLSEQEFVGEKGGEARAKARRRFRNLDENNDQWLSLKEFRKR
jgi:hypothetical protein